MSIEEPLDQGLRARLAELADAIFPGNEVMPSAKEVGVASTLVDLVLRVEPRLRGTLSHVLARHASGTPAADLMRLREEDEGLFRSFFLVVAAAYYLAPQVRDAIGYDGQQPLSIDPFELPSYLEDGTLDRVIARGPIYRDPNVRGGRP